MPEYIKTNETNTIIVKWPYTFNDLQEENPNVVFPSTPDNRCFLKFGNAHPVITKSQPRFDENKERLVKRSPELINGVWTITWDIVSLSSQQLQNIRTRRINAVRAECDRRIRLIFNERDERFAIIRVNELLLKGKLNWTSAEAIEANTIEANFQQIRFLKGKAEEIEAMMPIPLNFRNDSYWS